jgi:hypothetical protein
MHHYRPFTLYSSQVIGVLVNKKREKMAKKAVLRKKGKNLSVMGITVITISFKQKIIIKCR